MTSGARRSSGCTRRTTSRSSPGGCARRRARASCVLGINSEAVTIKQVEVSIIDRAWDEGWVTPQPPERLSGKTVAVVGSGPAGLAAAQQLTRAGHTVAVLERADAIGGLLRYGIPEFKMEKRQLDRRLEQMSAEGTRFKTGVEAAPRASPARTSWRGTTPSCSRSARRRPATSRCPAGSSAGCCRPWTTCRTPTVPCDQGGLRGAGLGRRQARRSSSAAATPGPTAWAPRTGRAPRR